MCSSLSTSCRDSNLVGLGTAQVISTSTFSALYPSIIPYCNDSRLETVICSLSSLYFIISLAQLADNQLAKGLTCLFTQQRSVEPLTAYLPPWGTFTRTGSTSSCLRLDEAPSQINHRTQWRLNPSYLYPPYQITCFQHSRKKVPLPHRKYSYI